MATAYIVDAVRTAATNYDDIIGLGPRFHTDEQLRRIEFARRWIGDRLRTCKFQQILEPSAGPLIAIREFIISRKSMGGLQTDLSSRVLDHGGQPIAGLYAAGESAGFGGGEIAVQPTYTWQSKVFFDDNNDRAVFQQPPAAFLPDNIQDEVQDSYGLADLRVSYRPEAGSWTVGAFVTNLTDESYIIDAGNTGDSLGLPTFIAGRPASYGLVFKLKL